MIIFQCADVFEITIEFHCSLFGRLAKECLIYQSSNTFYHKSTRYFTAGRMFQTLRLNFVQSFCGQKSISVWHFLHLKQTIMRLLCLNGIRLFKQWTISGNVWIYNMNMWTVIQWMRVNDFVAIRLMLRNKCKCGTQTNNSKHIFMCHNRWLKC